MPAPTIKQLLESLTNILTVVDLPTEAERRRWVEQNAMMVLSARFPGLADGSLAAVQETLLRIEADMVVDTLNIASLRAAQRAEDR